MQAYKSKFITYFRDERQCSISHANVDSIAAMPILSSLKTLSARYSHTTSTYQNYIYMYGGCNQNKKTIPPQDNFYCLDLETKIWKHLKISPCPPPRQSHSVVVIENYLYIFGGASLPNVYDDLWSFNLATSIWRKIDVKQKPKARYNASMFSIQNKFILLFGGIDQSHIVCSNSFLYDIQNQKWIELINSGEDCYRCFPAVCSDQNGRIFMYGGGKNALMNGNLSKQLIEVIPDVNHLQLKTLKILPSKDNTMVPPGMIHHSMIELGNNLLIFGGMMEVKQRGMMTLSDAWLFNRRSFVWEVITFSNYISRAKCSVSKTKGDDVIYLFGGQIDIPDISETQNEEDKVFIRRLQETFYQNKSITNKFFQIIDSLTTISFPFITGGDQRIVPDRSKFEQKKPFQSTRQLTGPASSSAIVNPITSAQQKVPFNYLSIKPIQILTSMTFIGSIANLQKHTFSAVAQLVDCANMKSASYLRITQEFNPCETSSSSQQAYFHSSNQSCFYRFSFNGEPMNCNQFFSSMHSMLHLPDYHTKASVDFGNRFKLGGFRLGKALLFVYRSASERYVGLVSLESKIVPGSQTNYRVFFYIEDIKSKTIINNSGSTYKSFIQNFLRTQPGASKCLDLPLNNNTEVNYDIYIFQPNRILTNQGIYSLELNFQLNNDVYPLVNVKKIEFLDKIGYKISSQPDFSLQSYLGLLYLQPKKCKIYIGDDTDAVPMIDYRQILEIYRNTQLITQLKFQLAPKQSNNSNHILQMSTYAINNQNIYLQDSYGLLIYASGRLVKRFDINFGELFERKFYKNKYKTQKFNLHKYLGIIDVDSSLCKLDMLESDFEDNRLSATTWKNIKFNLKTEEAKLRPLSEKKSVLLGLGKDEMLKEMGQ